MIQGKDLDYIAETIRNMNTGLFKTGDMHMETAVKNIVATEFAAMLRRNNPRFDTQRFMKASGADV